MFEPRFRGRNSSSGRRLAPVGHLCKRRRDRVFGGRALILACTTATTTMSYYSPSGGSYPYSAYHPPSAGAYHAQHAAGAYPTTAYSQAYPPTTVQGYGATWPYYSYYPPQQQQAQTAAKPTAARPAVGTTAQGVQPSTPAATTPAAGTATAQTTTASTAPTTSILQATGSQRPYTATTSYTYVPAYRDTLAAASSGGARGSRKSTFRGLFTKERELRVFGTFKSHD